MLYGINNRAKDCTYYVTCYEDEDTRDNYSLLCRWNNICCFFFYYLFLCLPMCNASLVSEIHCGPSFNDLIIPNLFNFLWEYFRNAQWQKGERGCACFCRAGNQKNTILVGCDVPSEGIKLPLRWQSWVDCAKQVFCHLCLLELLDRMHLLFGFNSGICLWACTHATR